MKVLLKNVFFQSVISFLASLYIRFVFLTSRWTFTNFETPLRYLEEGKPFITCFWHARLLMLPYCWRAKKKTFFMLISAHKDGRLISKTVKHFGIETVSGSTKKGGMQALLEMVRLSKKGKTLGITPDGPRGPGFQVSDGTVMASYLAKADLIPVTYSVSRHKIFNTWDRFFLPFPFSRGTIVWGKPISYAETKNKFSSVKKSVKKELDAICTHADKVVKS
ncbi:lysophospholipid acyltransferase family protein [Alphaproteobacteria bacterium]|nr:lysophospholipid acyltransferase family protein [Alphaproteobacteria bacterium]